MIEDVPCHGADAPGVDDVPGDARLAGAVRERGTGNRIHGIPELCAEPGEISRALRVRRHGRLARPRLAPVPQPLKRAEPEQLIRDDRAAGARARLVLLLLRLPRLEEAARVQFRVAVELPGGAGEVVRARLRDDAHLAAGGVPVLRREVVRLDPDLLDRIGRRRIETGGLVEVREDRAVQREQVVVLIAAVDRHDRALAAIGRVLIRPDVGDAGIGSGQRDDVAAVHWEVLDPLVVDEIRLGRRPALQHRRACGDLDRLGETADAELEVEPYVAAGAHLDVLSNLALEP